VADLITVVVPARNEERSLAECLASVAAQDHPELEILVVVGPSNDATAEIAGGFARHDVRFHVVDNTDGRIPTALNLALARARGAYVVRVDAHSTVPPEYVRMLVDHLGSGRWGGVGGRKDAVAETPQGRAIAAALGSRFGVGDSAYHHAEDPGPAEHVPFGAYPTALLRAMGGWDESLDTNEDFELDYRLRLDGWALLLDPSVRIQWRSRETLGELFRQYRRYGRGKATVARRHPASLRPRHLAAPALVATLAAAATIARRRPVLAAAAVAPYALALGAASVIVAAREREHVRHLAGAFVAMHVGWGVGFWEGAIREAQARLSLRPSRIRSDSRTGEDPRQSPAQDPQAA
jgi:succinoglycan biosynthesis protein ExoA